MTELRLTDSEQLVLRFLLAAEPQPGEPLPGQAVFEALHRLVPCDVLGAVYTDRHGRITRSAEVMPRPGGGSTMSTALPPRPDDDHGGPFYLGLMRWREHPARAECCQVDLRNGDGVSLGYRNGTDAVVQYFFDREEGRFGARDLALLTMIAPVLQRLVRERPTPQLPASLTFMERQVLNHVAAGRSNGEIAMTLCLAVGTVRKHLENAYRKLGVNNRVAAIARLHGSDEPSIDLQERLERYA